MNKYRCLLFNLILFSYSSLQALDYPYRFEGLYGSVADSPEVIATYCKRNVSYFVPYNPVILEVGGYEGSTAKEFALSYPKGHILVFEPNPRAFQGLLKKIEGVKNITPCNQALSFRRGKAILHFPTYKSMPPIEPQTPLALESSASLLESSRAAPNDPLEETLEVPCVLLDDWCKEHAIDHIDLIHLDAAGFELQILESSPEILKTVQVIWTKTHFCKWRIGTSQYANLTRYLDTQGFRLFSHWYREGLEGEAVFIRKAIYESLFY